jgi:hypothetical protein
MTLVPRATGQPCFFRELKQVLDMEKTKRSCLTSVFVTLGLLLSACGTASVASTSRFRNAPRTLTPEAKLAIATLNLEGTPQAVDAAQAAKLLPLWELLVQLNASNSTAPQEIQAVVDQIRLAMTAAQLQAIDKMQITPADAFAGFQGGQSGRTGSANGSGNGGGSSSSSGTRRNQGGQSFFFGGGGPGGGPGGFAGGGFGGGTNAARGATASSTQTANGSTQSTQEAANAVSGFLANRVIRLLESKVQS